MKIDRLYIRGFGKFEDFSTVFSNGLNVVYGPNESGKSTLMAFIRAMLYGLKGGKTVKNKSDGHIKYYMPWSGSPYGGYMNFELDKVCSYRIDRDFDKGEVKLYDQDFNDITGIYADFKNGTGIAEKLIGLSEGIFEKTVFIKQQGTRIDSYSSKDLLDRISNIKQSGWEDISFERANMALKEALKQQVGTDRSYTRPLDLINRRLEELNALKLSSQQQNEKIINLEEELSDINLEIKKLSLKEKLFIKLIEICELKQELKQQSGRKGELDTLNAGIKKSQMMVNMMAKDKELLEGELEDTSKKLESLNERQVFSEDRLSGFQKEEAAYEAKIKAFNIYLGMFLTFTAVICILTVIFRDLKPWIAALPALASAALYIYRRSFCRKVREIQAERNKLAESCNSGHQEQESFQRLVLMLQKQLDSLEVRISDENKQLSQLTERFENLNIQFNKEEAEKLEGKIDAVSEEIWELQKDLDTGLTQTETELMDYTLEYEVDRFYKRIVEHRNFLTDEVNQKRIKEASLVAEIKNGRGVEELNSIEEEMGRLATQKRKLEQRGEALSIAMKTLNDAANEVQKKYIPVMNRVFNETFSGLTSNKYSDIRAGENLSIKLCDPNTEKIVPTGMLSSGTIDQMYLALRIAISETVLKVNETMPFIMDEPFAQYDDERTVNTVRYIHDISKKQQIIVFTCKQREVDLIRSQCACKICSLT